MEVLFLGTCACDFSAKLKDEFLDSFDFDARRSSSVLLNGNYLIDCGVHTLQSLKIANVDISKITDVFITHLHSDHFDVGNITAIAGSKTNKLRLWVREDTVLPKMQNVKIMRMKKHIRYKVNNGFYVTGLLANHDENVFPQHFLFEQDGKKLFYALDGAWLLHETYYFLKNSRLDMLVLDATIGDYTGDYRIAEHNSIPMIRLMLPSLKEWGTIAENTLIYLSHIAPSLHKSHKEIEKSVQSDGVKVAYDGLKVNI